MRTITTLLCLITLVLLSQSLAAQTNTAAILGRVLDTSGATVPGAEIRASNTATGFVRTAQSGPDGSYLIPSLPIGPYEIQVSLQAFRTEIRRGIVLAVGETARLEFELSPGQVTETVSVTAEAPLINTTSPELGVVIDPKRVEDLPINGRNFTQLVNLQPGVETRSYRGRSFSFNGLSQWGMNITLDGTDASFIETPTFGEMSGNSLLNAVSMESIAEVKVQTGAFGAEVGRAFSGGLNVITRSGTNEFHGSLFHFIRNDKMDARTYFAATKDPLRQNQFGGRIGGPIVQNQLFFFATYEGARRRIGQQVTGVVPTQSFRDRSPAQFQQMLARLPLPNEPVDENTGIHRRSDRFMDDENLTSFKVDHHTARFQNFVRYSLNKSQNSSPSIDPANRQVFTGTNHLITFSNAMVVNASSVNELRLGFNRWLLPRENSTFENGLGWLQVNNVVPGVFEGKLQWADNSYTIADTFSYRAGKHSIKTGFELRRLEASRIQQENMRYNYNTIDDFMANRVQNVRLIFGTKGIGLEQLQSGFFVQDDVQLTPRLMLNMGVRYEYYTPFTEEHGRIYNVVSDAFGEWRKRGDAVYQPDRNNWNPRFGFAYDLTGKQRTVLRGGAGVYTSPLPPFFIMDQPTLDPMIPFSLTLQRADFPGIQYPIPAELQQALNDPLRALQLGILPAVQSRRVLDPFLRDMYSVQWNLSLQHQFSANWSGQATYVGNSNLKVNSTNRLNLIDPATGRRPDPTIGEIQVIENSGRRNYHSLQLSAKKRESHGFSADVFYTWSHTLAYFGEDAMIQDFSDIAASYSNASTDTRHVLTFNYSYRLPLERIFEKGLARKVFEGWGVQGISRLSGGVPLNISTGRDIRGDGTGSQRPNYVGGGIYADDQSIHNWFNRSAFALPAAGTFGNLGAYTARGPAAYNFDLSIIKRMFFKETQELQFRAEFFSLPNNTIFGNPNSTFTNSTFGRITSATGNRQVQLGLRYEF